MILGLLQPLEHLLRHILNGLHQVGLPWAWSIVVLTVIVRMLLVPLTVKQIHSMQNMQRHAPQMKEIQKKYKGDRQKLNEELMKFYKENNINPASSCLPLLAQFPIFIGLYYTLRHFSKHPPCASHPKQPNFCVSHGDFAWLHHFVPNIAAHASSHWSGFVLLAIYVVSQLVSTLLMATMMDKTQRTMLLVLPVGFVFFLIKFPTGLVLYWVTTNLWTVGQGLITRRLVARAPAPVPERRSSRTPKQETAPALQGDGDGAPPRQEEPAVSQQPRPVRRKKKRTSRR